MKLLFFYLTCEVTPPPSQTMGRLNAAIKLFFCWGELFFVLVSFVFVVASGLVSSGQVAALTFPAARHMATWVLVLSGAVFLSSIIGCLGAVRQTLRRGCCSGRRMLCMHQLLLLTVLIFSASQVSGVATLFICSKTISSMPPCISHRCTSD